MEGKSNTKFYPDREIEELILSFDRPEDQKLFSQDVLLTYPQLEEEYCKVCPQRCDLRTAADKARRGEYSSDPKLIDLKNDMKLIAHNCMRFNGEKSPFYHVAQRFDLFVREKIEAYIQEKSGGRRVSSLRLARNSVASDEKNHIAHKRSRDKSDLENSSRSSTPLIPASFVTTQKIVELVQSLVRKEDKGAFVVDVASVYPELKASYEAICPNQINLAIVADRAKSGYYNLTQVRKNDNNNNDTDTYSENHVSITREKSMKLDKIKTSEGELPINVSGNAIFNSLPSLRADIELIVSNCIRFNALSLQWVKRAESFQRFAHSKIDDFIVRHYPLLKGTVTGVEKYASDLQQKERRVELGLVFHSSSTGNPSQFEEEENLSTSTPQNNSFTKSQNVVPESVTSLASTVKTPSVAVSSVLKVSPRIHIVADKEPFIQHYPLQPLISIPMRWRWQIIQDHLKKDHLRPRLVGLTIPQSDLFISPFTEDQMSSMKTQEEMQEVPSRDLGMMKTPLAENSSSVRIEKNTTMDAVIAAFVDSIRYHFHEQRHRTDFCDPFQYGEEDEQSYADFINVINTQFERIFLHALLYNHEKIEILQWGAGKVVSSPLSNLVNFTHCGSEEAEKHLLLDMASTIKWSSVAHYTYLVRFLVQFPQLISLACATSATQAGKGRAQGEPILKVSKTVLSILQSRVGKITEELLIFMEDYEKKKMANSN